MGAILVEIDRARLRLLCTHKENHIGNMLESASRANLGTDLEDLGHLENANSCV
jgi:hypothetical protein